MKIQIIFFFLFCSTLFYAQGGLLIGEDSHLTTKGSPAIVIENGKFQNDGNFSASNGAVIMYGTAPTEVATIGGSSSTNFHDLVIAKSSNAVRLDYDIAVGGDIIMQSGMLILNYSDIELEGSIIDEKEDSRITGTEGGAIIKQVDLDAPTSDNPGNMGLEITTTENLGTTMIRRSHVAREIDGNFSINRHFSLSPQHNSNLDATLRMHYFDGEITGLTESELKLWRFDESEWLSFEPAQSNTSENWIESTGVGFLYDFTLAENLEGPLPIELLEFTAVLNNRAQVDLNWTTSSEINNDYFSIERSRDGVNFETIEEVNGAGNSYQPLHYESLDPLPYLGISYYRLRQTDFDGSFTYSDIRVINYTDRTEERLSIFPNPTASIITIQSSTSDLDAFRLINMLGQDLTSSARIISSEENQLVLNISDLPSGIYSFVTATSTHEIYKD